MIATYFWLLSLVVLLPAMHSKVAVKAEWTTPLAPFQIADGLYYVGSQDLASAELGRQQAAHSFACLRGEPA